MADNPPVRIGREGRWLLLRRGQLDHAGAGAQPPWSLDVELELEGLSARTNVWLGPEGVERSLADFFSDLAANWRGWNGQEEWSGMEGGLRLACGHDNVGTVTAEVELSHLSGAGWRARAEIPVDPGQLDQVAQAVRRLLPRSAGE